MLIFVMSKGNKVITIKKQDYENNIRFYSRWF